MHLFWDAVNCVTDSMCTTAQLKATDAGPFGVWTCRRPKAQEQLDQGAGQSLGDVLSDEAVYGAKDQRPEQCGRTENERHRVAHGPAIGPVFTPTDR